MPNQNDSTQTPNPINPPVAEPSETTPPPVISPQSDLPPLPPAFQNLSTEKSPAITNTTPPPSDTGSAAPPDISSVISKPKKKFGGGKIIATILGLFLLVGGVGAGIILTQQPQLLQQKAATITTAYCSKANNDDCAWGCTPDENGGTCKPAPTPEPGPGCSNDLCDTQSCCSAYTCISAPDGHKHCITTAPAPIGSACSSNSDCASGYCDPTSLKCSVLPIGSACNNNSECSTGYCDPHTLKCTTPLTTDCSGQINCPDGGTSCSVGNLYPTCYVNHYSCPSGGNAAGCSTLASGGSAVKSASLTSSCGAEQIDLYCPECSSYINTKHNQINGQLFISRVNSVCSQIPTPTPPVNPPAPYCSLVLAYDKNYAALTNAQLSALTPGTVVNFCVSGGGPTGTTFDQAKFTINGTTLAPTTTHRTGSTDFCQSYTILSTDKTVNVSAQICSGSKCY